MTVTFLPFEEDEIPMPGGPDDYGVRAPLMPATKFELIPFAAITFSLGTRWLVKGLLASTGLATIFGAPKHFKSFVALDVAIHIAAGKPWAGRRVKQGAVVYIVAEGATGFADRVAGNRLWANLPDDLPFFLIKARPNLGVAQGDTSELIASNARAIPGIRLAAVFIDTLVRTLAGASENDDGMRNFTDNAETIADHFECLSVAVHHTGKDQTKGMRGSSALHGAVVSSWRVEKIEKMQARITLEDAKDGESGMTWTADLERYVYGRDEDDQEESVLVVSHVSEPVAEDALTALTSASESVDRPVPPQLRLFMACVDAALGSSSFMAKPFLDGPNIRVVSEQSVRDEYFARRGDEASDDAKRKAFKYSLKTGVERRLLLVENVSGVPVIWRKAA